MKKLLALMLAVLTIMIPVIADEFPNDVPPIDTPPQVYMLHSAYDICSPEEPFCEGTPEVDSCQVYDYDQCTGINGCSLVCDRYVDEDGICDGNSPCHVTIQDAIDVASPRELICVFPGTYAETVIVNKDDLTLKSVSQHDAIIQPTSVGIWPNVGAVSIRNNGVTIDGFEVDGSIASKNGINVYGASDVTIKNNIVHGTTNEWDGVGIIVWDWNSAYTVDNALIENNVVYDTGRMGIFCMDYDTTNSEYDLTEGHVIRCNEVYDTWKKGDDWSDAGGAIQINLGKDCSITDNLVYNTRDGNRGVYMFGSGSGNIINGNTLRSNPIGIQLWISGEGGAPIDWEGDIAASPEVEENNIYDNTNYGAISTNIAGTTMIMDAEDNWWGDASGPTHSSNPEGSGDAVSDNVDYDPWSTSEFEISECEPEQVSICDGTPDSCGILASYGEPKCTETQGCVWRDYGGSQPNGFDLQMDGCLDLNDEWRFEEYAFTGEQLLYEILVRDCNLAEDISYAKITVNDEVEALCNQIPASEGDYSDQVPVKCGGSADAGFDPEYDKVFECVLTVEPSWYGPKSVNIEAYDQIGSASTMGIAQSWFFNPAVIIDVDTNDGADSIWYELPAGQNVVFPGQTTMSGNKLVVTNLAEGGVDLWAFIAATDFTDPTHSGARCPVSNVMEAENALDFRCKIGTFEDDEWDDMTNKVNTASCSPDMCFNALPLLEGHMMEQQSIIGNLKSAECQFKLTIPDQCTGTFTEGQLQVIVKAV